MTKNNDVTGKWTVMMRCEIEKAVTCENCTEEQARFNPFDHAVDEQETQQHSWKVLSVESDN